METHITVSDTGLVRDELGSGLVEQVILTSIDGMPVKAETSILERSIWFEFNKQSIAGSLEVWRGHGGTVCVNQVLFLLSQSLVELQKHKTRFSHSDVTKFDLFRESWYIWINWMRW